MRLLILLASLAFAMSQSPSAWRTEGKALKAKGDAAGALAAFEKAAAEQPAAADLQDEIGFLLAVLGRNQDALARFERAIALDANYAPAHYHLAVAAWLRKDPNLAIPAAQTAVRLEPRNAEYRFRLGVMLSEVGHASEAVRELSKAAQLGPLRADIWYQLGQAQQLKLDLPGARIAYQKATDLKPASPEYRNSLGLIMVETGAADQALAQFRAVLRRDPNNSAAKVNIGYAYLQKGDYPKAAAHLQSLKQLYPDHAVVRYDLGLALKQLDQLAAAIAEFREAIRLEPGMVESYYTLGITCWQNGDFPATIDAMRNAIRLRPEYAEAHYMLGTALKQQGDLPEASRALEEAIRLNPETPGPFNTLAQVRQAQGDREAAKILFAKAAEVKKKIEAAQERKLGTMGHSAMDVPKGKPGR